MGSRKFEGGWVCVCSKRLFFCHGAGVCTWHVAAGRYKYRAASALLLSCSSPSISQLSLQNYHPNPSCSSVSPSLKDQWNECMFVSPCASTYTCSEVMICCFSMSPKHVSKNSMFVSASSGSNEDIYHRAARAFLFSYLSPVLISQLSFYPEKHLR